MAGTAVGVCGVLAKFAGLVPNVRIATLTWGTMLAAAGLALASDGSLRPPPPGRWSATARRALPFLALAVVGWLTALMIEFTVDSGWRDAPAVVVAAAVATLSLARSRPAPGRAVVSAVLAALVVAAGSAALFAREHYPLSPFPMYSGTQLDPREVTRHRILANTAGGDQVDLTGLLGSATTAELVRDADDDEVADALRLAVRLYEERRGGNLVNVRLVTETWQVVPYPGEPGVERSGRSIRLRLDV